jgi:multidrug resistance efflux pump
MAKKRLSSEVFYWDAPRRRLHKRDLFPLQMEINGATYFVSQWTIKYFKVVNYSVEIKLRQEFTIKLIIKFRDFNIQFDATAIPLHYDAGKQELVATFKNIPEEHQELLRYFSEALNSGDMVNIDNVLRRVDMPVTPPSTELTAVPAQKNHSQKIKRNIYTGLYLFLGSVLFLFTLASLYNSFFHINIETAFINSPVIPVQSYTQGTIKNILVSNNDHISMGQPLLTLDISSNDRLPKQYRIDVAKQQVILLEALIDDRNSKTSQQTRLSQTKLSAANASLQAEIINRNIKCNHRYASEIDRRNPKKRSAECQVARKKVTAGRAKVKASKAYRVIFSTGDKKNSIESKLNQKSLAILEARLELAQQKVKVIKSTPESLSGIETIYSPIAGKVIKIVELENQYMKKGELIAVIQKLGSKQFIQAHLSYEDASKLKVGSKAIAYSPLLPRDYPMVVEQVDFTDNILAVSRINLFSQHRPENKTAKVTLKFLDKRSETLPFALPVRLSIEKHNRFSSTVKQSLASLFNFIIGKAHAEKKGTSNLSPDDSTPFDTSEEASILPYCFAYTPDPTDCKSATHLFPQGFIDRILLENKEQSVTEEVKKNRI